MSLKIKAFFCNVSKLFFAQKTQKLTTFCHLPSQKFRTINPSTTSISIFLCIYFIIFLIVSKTENYTKKRLQLHMVFIDIVNYQNFLPTAIIEKKTFILSLSQPSLILYPFFVLILHMYM